MLQKVNVPQKHVKQYKLRLFVHQFILMLSRPNNKKKVLKTEVSLYTILRTKVCVYNNVKVLKTD